MKQYVPEKITTPIVHPLQEVFDFCKARGLMDALSKIEKIDSRYNAFLLCSFHHLVEKSNDFETFLEYIEKISVVDEPQQKKNA